MKKVKVVFRIGTTYVGSTYEEEMEFEFDNDERDNDIETHISEKYDQWVIENNQGGYTIESTETIEEDELD